MYPFNVRVYGLLINEANQLLISDEEEHGMRFSKLPGGGLEYGEGLTEALQREFIEECNTEIEVLEHFYTTDFYVKSVFNDSQIISVYYLVKPVEVLNVALKKTAFDFEFGQEIKQSFRWHLVKTLQTADFVFPTDKKVIELLVSSWK